MTSPRPNAFRVVAVGDLAPVRNSLNLLVRGGHIKLGLDLRSSADAIQYIEAEPVFDAILMDAGSDADARKVVELAGGKALMLCELDRLDSAIQHAERAKASWLAAPYGPADILRGLHAVSLGQTVRENPLQEAAEFTATATSTAAMQALIESEASSAGRPARRLARAMEELERGEEGAGAAYDHAVKAEEAIFIPLVLPNDQKATLGKVRRQITEHPKQFVTRLTPTDFDADFDPAAAIAAMIQLLFSAQPRHDPGDELSPLNASTEEARDALALATMLVYFAQTGGFLAAEKDKGRPREPRA